jgi:hypothetical protein
MRRAALFGCLFALLVVACGPSRVDLEAEAKKLLQQAVDENPALHAAGVRVESAQLVHETGTKYAGIATVAMRGIGPHSTFAERLQAHLCVALLSSNVRVIDCRIRPNGHCRFSQEHLLWDASVGGK